MKIIATMTAQGVAELATVNVKVLNPADTAFADRLQTLRRSKCGVASLGLAT